MVLAGPYRPPRRSPGQNWGRGKPSLGVLFSGLDNLFFKKKKKQKQNLEEPLRRDQDRPKFSSSSALNKTGDFNVLDLNRGKSLKF